MSNQQILINGNQTQPGNLHTIQHYLVNNSIHSQSNLPQQNVHVQIVKQDPPRYLIQNRQYMQQSNPNAAGQNQLIPIQQQQPPQQQQESPYWLLVEIESNSELNSYALVESKDVIQNPQLDSLTTGTLVLINLNGKQQRATVVMASSDKHFIHAEFNQLNKMAEENLNLKLREGQIRAVKRRRVSKDGDDDSTHSGWSGVSQNVAQLNERVISPSANYRQRVVEPQQQRFVPPMMFDQGTQTNTKLTGGGGGGENISVLLEKIQELQKLIELNEMILNEQKLVKNETKMNRLLLESFSDEFSAMRKSIQTMEGKFEYSTNERPINDSQDMKKEKILNGSNNHPYIIFEQHPESTVASENASINGNNIEFTVEEIDADDSGRSTSRMSYHDQGSMMSNNSVDYSFKKNSFKRSLSSNSFSGNSITSTPLGNSTNLVDEWAGVDGDVIIGSNKTAVAAHVLRSIDWRNYKTATRKLLVSLFSREILATKSLTGRPSPAFHDRNKPVKGKLDQNVINDIIQIVTRKCNVQESQVRTAITTKCADENKMLRNRKDNEEKKFKMPSAESPDDKENLVKN